MRQSRAELVVTELVAAWRALARIAGSPNPEQIRMARETALSLVAQGLLDEVLSGLITGPVGQERPVVVQRWRFAPARPHLEPCWPLTRLNTGDARFLLRLRPSDAWASLPRSLQREIARTLPLDLTPPSSGLTLPGRAVPVRARLLPEGDYLVYETAITPLQTRR